MGTDAVNDRELLITRCRTGDATAWRELVQRHAGLVNGILRGAFRLSSADAEDVFQEVFTRLYVRLDTLRDPAALPGWVAQVTRNAALDHLRRSSRELPVGEEIDDVGGEDATAQVLDALAVRQALASLPQNHQEVLERFFVRDQSYQTIGAELNIPPGTIASRISRALALLRTEVDHAGLFDTPAVAGPAARL